MTAASVATPYETVCSLLDSANRLTNDIPIRKTFVQRGTNAAPLPGPLAALVRRGDRRGLDLYLLLKAVASAAPFNSRRGAKVWARALQYTEPSDTTVTAEAISKIWARLDDHQLVKRSKYGRLANITLLREDGQGDKYTHPADDTKPRYFKLPVKYWINSDEKWCTTLSLPAKAMLLIALTQGGQFLMPVEQAPSWYGISADTAQRGLAELQRRGVLISKNVYKKAPLAPEGFTYDRRYTLVGDFASRWTKQ